MHKSRTKARLQSLSPLLICDTEASTGHVIFRERLPKRENMNQGFTRCRKSLVGVRRTSPDHGVYHTAGLLPLSFQIAEMTVQFYIESSLVGGRA
ncbi:hypothetical protein RvY_19173 [Ramazzottius varieornatus]|uniref:Uncharacterized protein n=1 Tax=Ramazzottius varieornatus TaxID=947166 RepID=A0A1D1W8H0_RAMVA|nr:hypothetical protein RvY_19173 [Ramazzottius varieornatus]